MNYEYQYLLYTRIQEAWIIGSVIWFLKRRDELPLVISLFLYYIFSFRLYALINGYTTPVDITPFGFEPITIGLGVNAQGIATLGHTFLVGTYMLTQNRVLRSGAMTVPVRFRAWLRLHGFMFAFAAIPISMIATGIANGEAAGGKVMAFEVSAYLYELPLMLISLAVMTALLWQCGGLPKTGDRVNGVIIFLFVGYLTFGPSGRFQFLGWILAVTIIMSTNDNMTQRITKMAAGFALALALFGVAGALRSVDQDSETSLGQTAWERLLFAEDANMIDGLALLQEVYPSRLPYSYGGEHLEILERPIPRSLWPGKPVGGYLNKLGIVQADTGFTLGISPGLFGSFYAEGGIVAVALLSILYGYGAGRLMRYSDDIMVFTGTLIRSICIACAIPLLRGGDLPGIYAWIFMAFWPCFLVMFLWRRELFVRRPMPPGWRPPRRLNPLAAPAVSAPVASV